MLQRQQQQKQEQQSKTKKADEQVSKIHSRWNPFSSSNGRSVVDSNVSIGSISTDQFSIQKRVRGERKHGINKAAGAQSSTIVKQEVIKQSKLSLTGQEKKKKKKKQIKIRRDKLERDQAIAERNQKQQLSSVSVSSSYTGSRGRTKIALDPNGVPETLARKKRMKKRLRQQQKRRSRTENTVTPTPSKPPRDVKIPILTMVDSTSNEPVPLVNSPSYNAANFVNFLSTASIMSETSALSKQSAVTPGRPPLHPKSISNSQLQLSKSETALRVKNTGTSRQQQPTDNTSLSPSTSPSNHQDDQPTNQRQRVRTKIHVLTTTSSSSANNRSVPRPTDATPLSQSESNLMDDMFSTIWNVLDNETPQQQLQQNKVSSAKSNEVGAFSDVSTSEDELDYDDSDLSSLDDSDDSLERLDEDKDDDDDDDGTLLVMVDKKGKAVDVFRTHKEEGEEEELYLGGNEDVLLGMKRMYISEMKDITKSMKGWFDSFSLTPLLEENDDDEDSKEEEKREPDNCKESRRRRRHDHHRHRRSVMDKEERE
ncbi:hypothetical protein IV203_014047 [Nitzschia inconspicua]|uniref:Uncharacterized protein n=1 Tax=Nitzschia inconspicua TaxID=303405 RepID=A0A9K3Q7W9_9STRA|nr:hypothetical protein IV203_014047 [Nitzschia inconspicua]